MKYLICTRPPGIYPKNIAVAEFCNLSAFYLKKKGADVVIVYTHRKPTAAELDWLNASGLKWRMWSDKNYYGRNPKDFLNLIRLLKEERPDVVEFHSFTAPLGLFASKILNIKNRVIWYDTLAPRDFFNSKDKIRMAFQDIRSGIYFKLSSTVIANSKETMKENIKYYNTSPEKIFVKYLGINIPEEQKTFSERDEFSLVCIGRLIKPKGQQILINAIPEIIRRYPKLKIYFAGPGNKDWLEELAKKNKVTDNCVFTGELSRAKIFELLSKATIAVFPTLAEGFGLVAIEALACGTPLVVSKTGGLKDFVEENKSGIFVEPGNVEELQNAILDLLSDKNKREQLSANAIERAKYFDIHTRAEDYSNWLIEHFSENKTGRKT